MLISVRLFLQIGKIADPVGLTKAKRSYITNDQVRAFLKTARLYGVLMVCHGVSTYQKWSEEQKNP